MIENDLAKLEEKVRKHPNDVQAAIDLLFAYFILNDPGEYQVDPQFLHQCNERFVEVLTQMLQRFSGSVELAFWANYFQFVLGWPDEYDDVDPKFANQSGTKVPFFYFYDQTSGAFEDKAKALLKEVSPSKTLKEKYIVSILAGCLCV